MSSPPTGLVTLLFADIESSSEGLQQYGDAFRDAIRRLQDSAQALAEHHDGYYANNAGDGFLLTFAAPLSALLCACDLQRLLLGPDWGRDFPPVRLRIGLHTGAVEIYKGQYDGPTAWRGHRVMDAAHGTQILLSDAAQTLLQQDIASRSDLRCNPLGTFRLRDLLAPLALFRISLPGLSQSERPPRALPGSRHNLPEEERPFIGRRRELDDVLRLFRERGARLVTITGIGGMGKTRLAKQAAAEMVEEYPDGVWLAELDSLRERDEILPAVCYALRLDAALAANEQALHTALAGKRLLLLLDCFELLQEHAGLIERLLRFAPGVHCLVTSRKLLGRAREFEYPLEPMGTEDQSAGESGCDSVALFAEAAGHVDYQFAVTPENRAVIRQICERLEGIPLSIVLAAGWLRHLTPTELLRQVEEDRLLPPPLESPWDSRHAEVRFVIHSSSSRLPVESQRLLYCLSLFVGGFYLEDARCVCGEPSKLEMLQKIARLGENSLVKKQVRDNSTRYRLLDTVREYLSASVQEAGFADDLDTCRRRHAERYAAFARQIEERMRQGDWTESTPRLWEEIGNLRAAIAFSIEQNADALIVDFADALGRIYFEAGLWSDFEIVTDAAENAARKWNRTDTLMRLRGLQGALARRRRQEDIARQLWQERLQLAEAVNDTAVIADTLIDLAVQAHEQGERETSGILLRQAAAICMERRLFGLAATVYATQSDIALIDGDSDSALSWALKAEEILPQNEDKDLLPYICKTLGRVYRSISDYVRAGCILQTGLRVALEGERAFSIGWLLLELGGLFEAQRRFPQAARAYMAAKSIHTQLASRLQDSAQATLARFQSEHKATDVQTWLRPIDAIPWKTIVYGLLEES